MTSVLSPLAPGGALARDPLAAPVSTALRPVVAPTGAETARAVRPVNAGAAEDRVRNSVARERPVGPPPSFDINVLQDIRARLADSAPEIPAPPEGEEADAPDTTAQPLAEDEGAPAAPAAPKANDAEAPHRLDKKV